MLVNVNVVLENHLATAHHLSNHVMGKSYQRDIYLNILVIDFKQALDSIELSKFMKAMTEIETTPKLISLVLLITMKNPAQN